MIRFDSLGAVYAAPYLSKTPFDFSPKMQVDMCLLRAKADEVMIPAEAVFVDDKPIGPESDNAALLKLNDVLSPDELSVVYFHHLGRLAHDSPALAWLVHSWIDDGIRVISLEDGLDTDKDPQSLLAILSDAAKLDERTCPHCRGKLD